MKRISTIVAALAFAVLFVAAPAQAQAQVSAASNSLGVNPRRDYTIKPGETVKDVLNVTNLHKSDDLYITINPIDFKASNQTGSPDLLLKQKENTRWSLKPYIEIPKSYTIPAGTSADIPIAISIPSNVGAGSYYSAIHYSVTGEDGGDESTNLRLSGSSVSLLFVRVPGEAKSSLQIQNFGAFNPTEDMTTGTYATFFGATKPKYLSYTLKNNGNLAEQPVGSIQLKDMFGRSIKVYEDANPNKSLVLIEQTRRIDFCMNETTVKQKNKINNQEEDVKQCEAANLMPGRYTANIAMLYGGQGAPSQEILAATSFWYLPAWFIIAVVAGLLLIAYLAYTLGKKIKGRGKPTYGTRRR